MKKIFLALIVFSTQAIADGIYTISDGINDLQSPDKDYPVKGPVKFIKEYDKDDGSSILREYNEEAKLVHKHSSTKYSVKDEKYVWDGNLLVEWISGYSSSETKPMTINKFYLSYDAKRCLTGTSIESQATGNKITTSIKCRKTNDGYVKSWSGFLVYYNQRGWLTRIVNSDDSIFSQSGMRQGLTETLFEYEVAPKESPDLIHVRVASQIEGKKSYYQSFYVDEHGNVPVYWSRGSWIEVTHSKFDDHENWQVEEHFDTKMNKVVKTITREIGYRDNK